MAEEGGPERTASSPNSQLGERARETQSTTSKAACLVSPKREDGGPRPCGPRHLEVHRQEWADHVLQGP
ncbi:hypothetical protein WJX74_005684 [Apatococcus lobatus]|uniref:Uncharacterized protein n=1 Tax=Apatococcus lobatus TaxID=904363 RepID=A0AAW1RWR2_9CHLO